MLCKIEGIKKPEIHLPGFLELFFFFKLEAVS